MSSPPCCMLSLYGCLIGVVHWLASTYVGPATQCKQIFNMTENLVSSLHSMQTHLQRRFQSCVDLRQTVSTCVSAGEIAKNKSTSIYLDPGGHKSMYRALVGGRRCSGWAVQVAMDYLLTLCHRGHDPWTWNIWYTWNAVFQSLNIPPLNPNAMITLPSMGHGREHQAWALQRNDESKKKSLDMQN